MTRTARPDWHSEPLNLAEADGDAKSYITDWSRCAWSTPRRVTSRTSRRGRHSAGQQTGDHPELPCERTPSARPTRRAPAPCATASRQRTEIPSRLANPCIRSGSRRRTTSTPASRQPVRQQLALVAQRVEPACHHIGRRQSGQVVGQRDRHPRVAAIDARREVLVRVPLDVRVGEPEPVAEQLPGHRSGSRYRSADRTSAGRPARGDRHGPRDARPQRPSRRPRCPRRRRWRPDRPRDRRHAPGRRRTPPRHRRPRPGTGARARAGSRRTAPGRRRAPPENGRAGRDCSGSRSPMRRRGSTPATATPPTIRRVCRAGRAGCGPGSSAVRSISRAATPAATAPPTSGPPTSSC